MGAVIDLSNITTEQTIEIAASPEAVWDLVTDLSRTPDRNRETERTEWVPPHDHAVAGAVFEGTNRIGEREWTVPCHVIEAERGRSFEWSVLDPAEASTTWWYRLEPSEAGTLVRHGFQHGPGFSFLRRAIEKEPSRMEQIAAGRIDMLAANMRHTLGCLKAEAEAQAEGAGAPSA
jgi:uncharacterized protein YndB with AHSA1/START domain